MKKRASLAEKKMERLSARVSLSLRVRASVLTLTLSHSPYFVEARELESNFLMEGIRQLSEVFVFNSARSIPAPQNSDYYSSIP